MIDPKVIDLVPTGLNWLAQIDPQSDLGLERIALAAIGLGSLDLVALDLAFLDLVALGPASLDLVEMSRRRRSDLSVDLK